MSGAENIIFNINLSYNALLQLVEECGYGYKDLNDHIEIKILGGKNIGIWRETTLNL